MDIRLPDESGLELTKKIKITTPKVKILILTGHHYPEYKEMAAQYGADGFLVKGGSSKEVLQMVESFFPKAEASTIAGKRKKPWRNQMFRILIVEDNQSYG